jgi:23S rRNA (uracil1939-C5)-methyltransferase
MLKVGQVEQTEITGYSSEGMGICRIDGCAVFVPNAIRGELCEIKVTHVSRNSAHGKIEQIIRRSPHRIPRSCPEAKRCGGCQLHHMDYEEELAFKAQKVTDALNRIGNQRIPLVRITGADGITKESGIARGVLQGQSVSSVGAVIGRPSKAVNGGEQDEGMRGRILRYTQNDGVRGGALDAAFTGGNGMQEEKAIPADAFAYRNKAQYPVAEQDGKPVAGFYRNRTHEVIPVKRCAILPEIFDRVRDVVIRWASEDRVSVYDEHTGKGLLRHIYVRKGAVTGQIMVCLVVNGKSLPREQRLVNALCREIPGLSSVVLSVNTRNTNVVLGDEFRTLWGKDEIEDELCGFSFRLSPRSFYQVNHDQAQRLYAKAVELAELHGTETVLDLYCGTGTITLALSRKAGRAIGVEVIPQAIEDAKENALRNGVNNVEFFCADAGEAAQRFVAETAGNRKQETSLVSQNKAGETDPSTPLRFAQDDEPGKIDVIVVDPPRKGLAPEVIDAVVTMAPARVVYVSCDPATLARDVKLFSERGYSLTHAEAFDLFPRTFHVETVVLMTRAGIEATGQK